jgi:DNA-binding SARP family transcriptional activator/tetratricopeptide (TPR) repeat protein
MTGSRRRPAEKSTTDPLPPLRFTLLGSPETGQENSALHAAGYRRARILLAYLLMEAQRIHRRDTLAGLLWGDLPAGEGRARLRRMLFVLRQAVDDGSAAVPLLLIRRDTVGINPARPVELDARLLLESPSKPTDAGSAARIAAAVERYRAPFLEGFDDLVDATPLTEWLVHWRRVLHGAALSRLEALCQWHLAANAPQAALAVARRLWDLASDNESQLRLVMNTLAGAGHAAEAIDRFESFRQLHEQLGLAPEPATCALAADLRQRMMDDAPVTVAPEKGLERRPAAVVAVQMLCRPGTDAEQVAEYCALLLQPCRDLLARRGGHVIANPTGGLLAWFGFPRAVEEAPRKAVEAALALGDVDAPVPGVHLRVAVHHGTLVTDGNPTMPDVSGLLTSAAIALHGAARAEPQSRAEILASESVWRLVHGYFQAEHAGEVPLAGSGGTLRVFRILGPTRARHRLEATPTLTPFVARDAELARLETLWHEVCAGRGVTVVLRGEAGIGKSRLVETFRKRVQRAGALTQVSRCENDTQGSPFLPVVSLLQRTLVALGSDADAVTRYAADLLPDNPHATALLRRLLALPPDPAHPLPQLTPPELRRHTTELLLDLLVARSGREPVLLVLEDAHWADPSTMEMVHKAMARVPSLPVMLVLTSRPTVEMPHGRRRSVRIDLGPLHERAVAAMIAHLAPGLSSAGVQKILEFTGGVPLFVEAMARALASAPQEIGVPANLQDLLMARLEQCGEAKRLAQWAAILGNACAEALLQAVAPCSAEQFESDLEQLNRCGLLVPDAEGEKRVWRFQHALIQEAAYTSLARATRRERHRVVADQLLGHFRQDIDARPELVAHHLGECGETERAIRWWMKAGQKTAQRSANLEAVAHYRKGLALLAGLPPGKARDALELELRTALGIPLVSSFGYGAGIVVENYERAIALAGKHADQDMLFKSLWGLWHTSSSQSGYHDSLALAARILDLARSSGRTDHSMLAQYAHGNTLFCLGRFEAARQALEQAVALGECLSAERLIADFGEDHVISSLGFLSWTLCFLGETDAAWMCSRKSIVLAREREHAHSLAFALTFAIKLGWYGGSGGEDALCDELLALGERQGFAFWQATGLLLHGRRLAAAGDAQGVALLTGLLETVQESMRGAEVFFLIALAESLMALDMPEQTLATVARCLEASQRSGNLHYDAELHRMRGEMLLRVTPVRRDEAMACFRQAERIAREQGAELLVRRACASQARLQRGKKTPAKASDAVP